jgi:hypothetical protein
MAIFPGRESEEVAREVERHSFETVLVVRGSSPGLISAEAIDSAGRVLARTIAVTVQAAIYRHHSGVDIFTPESSSLLFPQDLEL